MKSRILLACVLSSAWTVSAFGSPILYPIDSPVVRERSTPSTVTASTLLELHFEGTTVGASGEVPTVSSGITYETGIVGSGAYLGPGDQLRYAAAGNIDATSGSVEFWIKPRWNGNAGGDHYLIQLGVSGGLLIGKDGGNFWRIILNRFGGAGGPELGAGLFVNGWVANEWHHAAFTWGPSSIKVYVDGVLSSSTTPAAPPPVVGAPEVVIGADGFGAHVDAVIDHMIISSGERTAEEIRDRYIAGLTVTALQLDPDVLHMYPTWRIAPSLTATTNAGTLAYPPGAVAWSTSDPDVAIFDAGSGKVVALGAGQATLTAAKDGVEAELVVNVEAPMLAPVEETIPAYLSTPAADHYWEIPVIVLRYLPTADGTQLDTSINPDYWDLGPMSLASLEATIDTYDARVKFGLEEGSRFRNGQSPARPSLGYRVVKYITVYEPTPPGKVIGNSSGHPIYDADYFSIFDRFEIQAAAEAHGVREIWFWSSGLDPSYPSYNPAIHHPENFRSSWESNMSSPTTGDISNSNRANDDLPVFGQTYTLYGYNFRRSQAEALHNHGHQVEALWSHAAHLQDGNSDLFWKKFVGQDAFGNFITGRCGWTHMPPNTTGHYDYLNPAVVASDIAQWQPSGGPTQPVSVSTWGNRVFSWPGAPDFPQRVETQWYLHWWQSVPGYGNRIPHGVRWLTNWWMFKGDWDGSIGSGRGLHHDQPTIGVESAAAPFPRGGLHFDSVQPNPSRERLEIRFVCSRKAPVRLDVVDVRGRRMGTLADGAFDAGPHAIYWDHREMKLRPGVYWIVGTTGGDRATTRFVVLR